MQITPGGRYFTRVTITIIGAGRMGGALAIALQRAGYSVEAVVYRGNRFIDGLRSALGPATRFLPEREFDSVPSETLIIASGDSDIGAIAERTASIERFPETAFHTSGSLSSSELLPLRNKGVMTASLHPLAAVSDPFTGPDRFRGSFFCVEGDPAAVREGKSIAQDLGGRPFSIPTESKALYHAAAVISAGHLVALLDAAIEMLQRCGLGSDEARAVLVPLASGSLANLKESPAAAALTGPFARGDAAALDRHLSAMSHAGVGSDLRGIYLDLAARSVEILIREGRELNELLDQIRIAKDTIE